jgi:hypothetical protein
MFMPPGLGLRVAAKRWDAELTEEDADDVDGAVRRVFRTLRPVRELITPNFDDFRRSDKPTSGKI